MLNLPDKEEILALVKGIGQDCQTLAHQEAQLLRAELKRDAQEVAKIGGEMALGGAVVGMGSALLVVALVFALSWFFPQLPLWGSFALVGLVLVATGAVLLARARANAKQLNLVPEQTVRSVKQDLRVLTNP